MRICYPIFLGIAIGGAAMGSRRQRDIRTNRSHPHHRLPAHSVLPLFDTLFGVALTLLAYSLPERLSTSMDAAALTWAILTYLLAGVAVVVYWYKLRRLVEISRVLFVPQLIFGVAGLLLIVLMPKLAQLVVLYGGGTGDLLHWTPSQIVNTVFLACLLLFDGFCLLFAVSLLGHGHVAAPKKQQVAVAVRAQSLGFASLLVLGFLELASMDFNNEYIAIVPVILLSEEWWVARRLRRMN